MVPLNPVPFQSADRRDGSRPSRMAEAMRKGQDDEIQRRDAAKMQVVAVPYGSWDTPMVKYG